MRSEKAAGCRWVRMGSGCFPKPDSLHLVLGQSAGKLGLESLPTHPPAGPLLPMASTHSHPQPSCQPPHPSWAWPSGESSFHSPRCNDEA